MAATALLILCFHTRGFGSTSSVLLSAVSYSEKFAHLPNLSQYDSLLSFPVCETVLGNSIRRANLSEGKVINQLC